MSLEKIKARMQAATPLKAKIYTPPFDQEIALYWENPYENREEKFASIWWPAHPIDKTEEVEHTFEATAEFIAHSRDDIDRLVRAVEVMREGLKHVIIRVMPHDPMCENTVKALANADAILGEK